MGNWREQLLAKHGATDNASLVEMDEEEILDLTPHATHLEEWKQEKAWRWYCTDCSSIPRVDLL